MQSTISNNESNQLRLGWLLFTLTALFYFYDFILRMIPSVMMDEIIRVYHTDATDFALLESSFYFMYTPLQLFAGPLVDEYGNKRIFPLAILCCLVGALLSALEIHFNVLVLGRMLIGLGSAFAFVIVLKTASEWLPSYYYPFLSGLTTTLGMIGGIVAEVLLPSVIHYGSTLMYMGCGLFAIFLISCSFLFMQDKESHEKTEVDFKMIVYDIYAVLSLPQMWIIGLVGCFLFTPVQLFITWAKSFFMHAMHINEANAGHITSMLFWGVATGAPFNGWLSTQIGNKKVLLKLGSILACLNMLTILYIPTSPWIMSLLMYTLGFFMSSQCLIFVFAKNLVTPHLTATAVATANMIVNLSSYIQPLIGMQLASYHKYYEIGKMHYTTRNWQLALMIIPLLLFAGCILSFFIKEESEKSQSVTVNS